jgi:hypothetical protein
LELSHVASKEVIDQQEDLARSGYKTNKEVESLGILLHVARTTRISIYEGRSFVLFCIVVMRSTKLGCFRLCSTCLWKALSQEGCMGLVPWRLNLRCKSSGILNDFFNEN